MLPNFCRGRGDRSRSRFDRNLDNLKTAKIDTGASDSTNKSNRSTMNLYNNDDRNRTNSLNSGYLPGTNPGYALNGPLPPPDGGNDYYSNTAASQRYKDTKQLYGKDYLTTINLIVGILISLSVIAKKST
tara:strand:- start:261 stop:650 length:390 start_codon:yes stop_codon:yes gene_type:complete